VYTGTIQIGMGMYVHVYVLICVDAYIGMSDLYVDS